MWQCQRCSTELPERPTACPSCGLEFSRMPPTSRVAVPTETAAAPSGPFVEALEGTTSAPPVDVPLEGTTWSGADSDGHRYKFEFRPKGVLRYTSRTGTFDNGRWTQTGAHVAIDMNNHYADYAGDIVGDQMTGKAKNKPGREWTWSVTRQAAGG